MRNRFVLFRKYAFLESQWVFNSLKQCLREILLIVIFERHKLQKLKAILLGVSHALLGHMGKLPAGVLE
jgi:hypothetical protein